MKLTGYSRKNSKAGIRDYNVIFSTVALTNRWGEIVSNKVPEAILCCGELTRGLRGIDLVRQNEFTKSLILHPNIGSILILTIAGILYFTVSFCFTRVTNILEKRWERYEL